MFVAARFGLVLGALLFSMTAVAEAKTPTQSPAKVPGKEPEWTGRVIKRGAERAEMDATPILERPNRPLHFYGNTVRRRHYRGSAMPTTRDFANGARALVTERD